MEIYILIAVVAAVVIVGVAVAIALSNNSPKVDAPAGTKPEYAYMRKQFIMTKSENDFYQVLQRAVGANCMIFPQAHLDLFLDHKVKGQNWKAALSKIQRKSVDFLICSNKYYNPLVAIELDGVSHSEDERMARDDFVDGICKNAGMPIVHILSNGHYDVNELGQKLALYLK